MRNFLGRTFGLCNLFDKHGWLSGAYYECEHLFHGHYYHGFMMISNTITIMIMIISMMIITMIVMIAPGTPGASWASTNCSPRASTYWAATGPDDDGDGGGLTTRARWWWWWWSGWWWRGWWLLFRCRLFPNGPMSIFPSLLQLRFLSSSSSPSSSSSSPVSCNYHHFKSMMPFSPTYHPSPSWGSTWPSFPMPRSTSSASLAASVALDETLNLGGVGWNFLWNCQFQYIVFFETSESVINLMKIFANFYQKSYIIIS